MNRLRHFIFDLLGIVLILLSPTLGWLPGPGGIPLFLAGLGLLAVHHDWAKRAMIKIKNEGMRITDRIFVDHPVWQTFYDVLSAAFLVLGIFLLNTYTRNLTLTLAILLVFTGLTIFFGNRNRLDAFMTWLKKQFRS